MSILPPAEEKAAYVERMFTTIAPGYDLANRVMTFGLDQDWRHRIVETVAPPLEGRALDVGTGTGDFLPLLAAWLPDGIAVGVDFCLPMMQEGWGKLEQCRNAGSSEKPGNKKTEGKCASTVRRGMAAFVGGDALCLPFPDNSFDAITTGFTIRNVTDIDAAFREMWRVARPGGVLACLEVTHPQNRLIRLFHRLYFTFIVPRIGGWLSGNLNAYIYLEQSARAFPPANVLADMMRGAGWSYVHYRLLSLGAVAIHSGVKL
jgi:demethylmenaquinone methyltransferase / 2-methoxy-6-polyprenyl-1,4-benzoquinol methylase